MAEDPTQSGFVLVTGGTRGLGRAIALRLARSGRRVVAVARSAGEPFEEDSIAFEPADLGETGALPTLVRRLRKEHGPIDALVNNAGISAEGLLATLPDARIAELIRVNVEAPIVLTKYVLRSMMADLKPGRLPGRIVTVSSIVATTGFNALSVYAATKASAIGFTRSLAREVGRLGITVNAVAPGFVDTALTAGLAGEERERVRRRSPLGVLATPDDVAGAVAYLLGPDADRVTGTVLTVDAGSTA